MADSQTHKPTQDLRILATLKRSLHAMTIILTLGCSLFVSIGYAADDSATTPATLAVTMETKLKAMLAALDGANADEQGGVAGDIHNAIDFAAITRGVLGKHRKTVSDSQKQRFQLEFEQSMIQLLRTATRAAGDYSVAVTDTKISKKNAERAQIFATVTTEDSANIDLISAVARVDGQWKVRNLVFSGVNLGLTYRNQFDQLMQSHDNDADKAIDAWAAQVTKTELDGV